MNIMPTQRMLAVAVIATGLWLAHAMAAPSTDWEDDGHSYDKARRAVSRGEALPVTEVMRHLTDYVSGDVVAVEYEHEYGRWVYEFKVIDHAGRLRMFHLDAATGEFVHGQHD